MNELPEYKEIYDRLYSYPVEYWKGGKIHRIRPSVIHLMRGQVCFLVFDEYVAFMECLTTKESMAVLSQLKKIIMLGRQAGYFLVVACQRPDAKYFSDGIRDQFNFRVALGRVSELGYGMMFGADVKKKFFQKRIKQLLVSQENI